MRQQLFTHADMVLLHLKKSDIICIEAEGRYSYVYTKDDKIDSVNSLSEWMNVLAGINKSYKFLSGSQKLYH